LPKAFKRAGQDSGPDEQHQLLALWHNRRRSILTSRQHLVNEAEHLLCELPLELRGQLPDTNAVRPRRFLLWILVDRPSRSHPERTGQRTAVTSKFYERRDNLPQRSAPLAAICAAPRAACTPHAGTRRTERGYPPGGASASR